jgi:hypothetical protein
VGEAFTKDKKSSAAAREGLVDMTRVHDCVAGYGVEVRKSVGRPECSRVCRSRPTKGMRLGWEV